MALKKNTWKLNQWYDQDVAGNVSYSGAPELWAWGDNEFGGLGINNRTVYSSPIQISTDATWKFPPSGGSHTAETQVLVKTDGTLWSWGYNQNGLLGQNSPISTHLSSPTQIPGTTWNIAVAGRNTVMATKTDGTLWVWGNNWRGVMGIPSYAHNAKVSSPVQVGSDTTWDKIYTSNVFASALKTDGTFWSWGNGGNGVHGQNDTIHYSSPVQVPGTTWAHIGSGAEGKVLATKTDGTLWAWGRGYHGGLGNNTSYPSGFTFSSPVQIPGTDWDYSSDYKLANSDDSSFVVKTNGQLWSFGYNNYGNLGLNDILMYSSPVQVGTDTNWSAVSASYSRFTLAIKTDGTLWNWGNNSTWMGGAYLGDIAQNTNRSSPVQVPGTWGNVIAERRNVFVQKVI